MTSDDRPGEHPPLVPNYVHVVRTAQTMHLSLSQMADQKASILMGATFVIFTLAVGQAKGGIPPLPLAILGGFAFVSALLAVSVVMPSIGTKRTDPDAPVNLLFFGSFVRLSEDDYVEALRERVRDDNDALEIMVRDLYQNGRILADRKYRLLGYAYLALMTGLAASLGAVIWEMAR
ncbi:Pycsar system effector family protein [Sphingomonas bacterium]|uniref:Pycsar system effector family protein n=1 Tax=Sphingomonas bacterium TaxID=1895847 RepID=UPI002607AF40|nr:Pycsar system effector family protein [Sphingomonas bacterium]MDB5678308.1 hypothetical protein [Sphingomonas bacterium]